MVARTKPEPKTERGVARSEFLRQVSRRAKDTRAMVMWCVYDHPRDYPDSFVVRPCLVVAQQVEFATDCFICESVESVRAALPTGLWNMGRHSLDDPTIREVWI